MTADSLPAAKSSILRKIQVCERTGLSGATIYNKLNKLSPSYDPAFPQQVRLGRNAVGWIESEVDAWISSRVADQKPGGRRAKTTNTITEKATVPPKEEAALLCEDSLLREKRILTLQAVLEKQARTGTRIFVDEAMGHVMLNPNQPDEIAELERIVATISRNSHIERKGLLGVLVHERKRGTTAPSERFFELAKSLGYKVETTEKFVREHLEHLYVIREDSTKKSKGSLRWYRGLDHKPVLVRE